MEDVNELDFPVFYAKAEFLSDGEVKKLVCVNEDYIEASLEVFRKLHDLKEDFTLLYFGLSKDEYPSSPEYVYEIMNSQDKDNENRSIDDFLNPDYMARAFMLTEGEIGQILGIGNSYKDAAYQAQLGLENYLNNKGRFTLLSFELDKNKIPDTPLYIERLDLISKLLPNQNPPIWYGED